MGRAFEFRKARKMKRWSAMSKAFTRIGKDIVMAVKEGGADPDSNSRLRAVIQNGKAVNMPKDNIERAIKRASDKSQGDYKEVLFEGYAPHGIAILVETATDNNTRTVANVRSYFNKCNGSLGTSGSVVFMFDHTCNFRINSEGLDVEEIELEFIDFGAEEVFADRNYTDEGNLVSRREANAMIHSADEAVPHVLRMVEEQAIFSVNGKRIPTEVDSICVHGDGPAAVATAQALREALEASGVAVKAIPDLSKFA